MEVTAIELIERLEREHSEVREALASAGPLAESRAWEGFRAALAACAAVLGEGLDEHSKAEDAILFPLISEMLGHDLVDVFTAEHVQIRALRDVVYGQEADAQRVRAFIELGELLGSHMDREDGALFPAARGVLRGS